MRYAWEVVCGTHERPLGYVGTYGRATHAKANAGSLSCPCFIRRVLVEGDEWREGRLWSRDEKRQNALDALSACNPEAELRGMGAL